MNSKLSGKFALLYCCTILMVVTTSAAGQAGHLDPTFGRGGIAAKQSTETQITNVYSVGAIAIQGDGKIVVAGGVPGNNDFTVPAVLRFLPNGSLDNNFGLNGVAVLPNSFGGFGGLAIQPDGKILVSTNGNSSANGQVIRLTSAGTLDSTFGNQGVVTFRLTTVPAIALQPDGRILASLQSIINTRSQVTRLLGNGSTDTSFGTNGIAFPPGGSGAMEVLGNGDILVFGGLISRLTSSGVIDEAFGVNGQLIAPTSGQAVAASGDILAAGALVSDPTVPSSGFAAFAYQSVGIGDPAFGRNGGVSTTVANFPTISTAGMAIESTGAIVELGTVSNKNAGAFGLVRYTAQGQLDATFGSGGTATTTFGSGTTPNASAIAIQSDDKIIAAGTVFAAGLHGEFTTALVVARYLGK